MQTSGIVNEDDGYNKLPLAIKYWIGISNNNRILNNEKWSEFNFWPRRL